MSTTFASFGGAALNASGVEDRFYVTIFIDPSVSFTFITDVPMV